jgi:hypothetical protein
LQRHLITPWQAGVAVLVAVASGVIGGGWAIDARADVAAGRREAHAVSLAAAARLVGAPGEAGGLEVVLVNAGTRPVTVTGITLPADAPVSSSEPVEPVGVLASGASSTLHLGRVQFDCAGHVPDRLSILVGVRAADAQPQQLEIPVVGADDAFAQLVMQHCQDLDSRITVRLAGDWRHRTRAGSPQLAGMLEVVAEPPIGVQLLEVSGWAPFILSSPVTPSGANSAPAHVRGFRVTVEIGSCAAGRPPDQGLLGLLARIRASDGRELDAQVEVSTEAAAALVGLYNLICGDAAGPGGLRVDAVPADGWWAEPTGPEPVVWLHGRVEVTTTTDQVTLTGVSEAVGTVNIRPEWNTPLRLSGPGRSHYVEIVVVLNCTLEELDATPKPTFLLHGQAGGLPQSWPIPLAEPLRQAAEKACGDAAASG